MGTKYNTIYPPPLVMPTPTIEDEGKEPYVSVQTFGDTGDGRDGDLIVTANTVLNKYAGLNSNSLADYPAGSTELVLDVNATPGDFAPGDKIMIIQMQVFRATLADLGLYEINEIQSMNGSIVTLKNPTINKYYSDDDGYKVNATKAQIVKIPQYNSIDLRSGFKITATPWNGYSGGIAAICVTNLFGAGNIDVTGCGYLGGKNSRAGGEGYNGANFAEETGGVFWAGYGTTYPSPGIHPTVAELIDLAKHLTFGGGAGAAWAPDHSGDTYQGANAGGIVYVATNVVSSFTGALISGRSYSYNAYGESGSIYIVGVDATAVTRTTSMPDYSVNNSDFPPPLYSIKYRVPPTIANTKDVIVVADIDTRDASSATGMVYVGDATADPTVKSGGALYIWNSVGSTWVKLAEFESMDLPTLGVNDWKLAVNGETIVNGMGYVIDASAGPIALDLPLPTVPYSFQFGYRVVNVDNPISINTNGAFWEGIALIDDTLDIVDNNVSGQPVYAGAVKGWIETDMA